MVDNLDCGFCQTSGGTTSYRVTPYRVTSIEYLPWNSLLWDSLFWENLCDNQREGNEATRAPQ